MFAWNEILLNSKSTFAVVHLGLTQEKVELGKLELFNFLNTVFGYLHSVADAYMDTSGFLRNSMEGVYNFHLLECFSNFLV